MPATRSRQPQQRRRRLRRRAEPDPAQLDRRQRRTSGSTSLPPGGTPSGVTPNDSGDADTGANGLQNFPVITSAEKLGGATQIVGTLSTESNETYRLDFYASDDCDPSGNGEGEIWLGNENVTTNSDGNGSFDTGDLFGSAASPGDAITATATDPDGNTSEFSACELVGGSGGGPATGRIVFHSELDSSVSEIYTINADGTDRARLTTNGTRDEGAQFSPDGSAIVFGSNRSELWQLYVMDADGTDVELLSGGNADDTTPSYSPDGSKIAFTRRVGSDRSDIFVMNADGTGVVNVTSTIAADEDWATWSPDGTRLAFASDRDGDNETSSRASSAPQGRRELTFNSASDHDPDWSPDGSKIAFASDRPAVPASVWVPLGP